MSADASPPRPKRMYGPSHIEVACRALEALSGDATWVTSGTELAGQYFQAKALAVVIIATGLSEIYHEHTRANESEAP